MLSLSVVAICLSTCSVVWSQQPPPPPPPREHPGPPRFRSRRRICDSHIEGVRRQLAQSRTNDPDDEILVAAARQTFSPKRKKNSVRSNEVIVADRLVAASDAFLHATRTFTALSRRSEKPFPPSRQRSLARHLQLYRSISTCSRRTTLSETHRRMTTRSNFPDSLESSMKVRCRLTIRMTGLEQTRLRNRQTTRSVDWRTWRRQPHPYLRVPDRTIRDQRS